MEDAGNFITTNPPELIIGETGILEFTALFNEFSSKYKNVGHKLLFFVMNECFYLVCSPAGFSTADRFFHKSLLK